MKLVIFGASGGTGQHLVQQALAQDRAVTAFARDPQSVLAAPAPGLTVVQGDIHNRKAVFARLLLKLVRATILREPFRSQRKQEQLFAESDVQYTIVRPPELLNRPAQGHYRVQEDGLPPGGMTIPRADVADFMLRQLTDPQWIRKSPYIAT